MSAITLAGAKRAFIPVSCGSMASNPRFFRVDRKLSATYIGEMVSDPNELTHGLDVDKLVLATVNAPYKRDIAASTLAACLHKADTSEWLVHVATFFTDVSPALIFAFSASHGISRIKLAEAYLAMKAKTGELNLDLEAMLEPVANIT